MPNDQTAHPEPATSEPTKRQRLFRGRMCPVVKSVRNVNTGAVYDLVEYQRQVTNRRDGSISTQTLTRKLRRTGTGTANPAKEVEIETEIEGATAT